MSDRLYDGHFQVFGKVPYKEQSRVVICCPIRSDQNQYIEINQRIFG